MTGTRFNAISSNPLGAASLIFTDTASASSADNPFAAAGPNLLSGLLNLDHDAVAT